MTVGETAVGAGLIYCELMSDIERISDHMLNIAQAKPAIFPEKRRSPACHRGSLSFIIQQRDERRESNHDKDQNSMYDGACEQK